MKMRTLTLVFPPLRTAFVLLIGAQMLTAACSPSEPFDSEAYKKEIEEWQKRRIKGIGSANSWLTLVGLSWLHEGENQCGSAEEADVRIPEGQPPLLGSLFREADSIQFTAAPGISVTVGDSSITSVRMLDDHDPNGPTIIRHGSVSFYVIRRAEKLGVRVKDSLSTNRMNFKGLEFFPVDPKWRVQARYTAFEKPLAMTLETEANTTEDFEFHGYVSFVLDGNEHRVDVTEEKGMEGQLYIMFTDETSGLETYGAGRQLYADLPGADNKVILDFNRAYNWPCVYTEYATCPLPPPQNHIPVRVEAGEFTAEAFQTE